MVSRCTVPDEELIAYLDGYLEGDRQRRAAAHAHDCERCRQRIAIYESVDALLATAIERPPSDGAARARLRAKVLSTKIEPTGWRGFFRSPHTFVLVAIALVLLLSSPIPSSASWKWPSFIELSNLPILDRFDTSDQQRPVVSTLAPTEAMVEPDFSVTSFEVPPFNLELTERLVAAGAVEDTYRNADGLELLVSQSPLATATVHISPSSEYQTMDVDGVVVVWLADPRPGAVAALFWQANGVAFELLVSSTPANGLPLNDAVTIVRLLNDAQSPQDPKESPAKEAS